MKYYKVSPEWAKKLNVAERTPVHPDGWHLLLPTFAMPLMELTASEEYGHPDNLDDAVRAIGGCVYSMDEAMKSQRGEKEYRMDIQQEEEVPQLPECVDPAEPQNETPADESEPEAVTLETKVPVKTRSRKGGE